MKNLTITNLNKAIAKFSRHKMAPEGLIDLVIARDYLLGKHNDQPQNDPRDVLERMGWRW